MAHQTPGLESLEPRLVKWLLENQDLSGGWGEHKGGTLSTFNTAEAVMALSVAAPVDSVAEVQQAIRKAVKFLLKERDNKPLVPPDAAAWFRTAKQHGDEHRAADIVRTALIVGAFSNAGEDRTVIASAVDWLLKRQNNLDNDSGWGYQRGSPSKTLPTCFTLLALIAATPANDKSGARESIERGMKHLTEKCRKRDGSFGTGLLTACHTIYCCLVMQAARNRGFSTIAEAENQAIDWLLRNQDDALSPIEEVIEIDPDGVTNYPFMFTMEALLLRVLANSQDEDNRRTRLWLDIQRSMQGAFDENTGGLYGRRVFSWSTANGLYAIKASEDKLAAIPGRQPEVKGGVRVGHAILFLVLVLVGACVYLTSVGKFATLQAVFFGGLVLACLVAYGSIGELTFKELVTSLLSPFQAKAKEGE
jgi:hypothetical protein